MGTMINRRRVYGSGEKNYTLVDWIENTNANSLITTNVELIDSNNYKFVGVVTPISYNRKYTPFFMSDVGTDANNKKWKFAWAGRNNYFFVLTNSASISGGINILFEQNIVGVKTSFEISYQKAIVNGTTYASLNGSNGKFLPNAKIVLAENSPISGIMKWHELDVYLDDVLISKLRPCVTKDGVYTMVDVLTDYICPTEGSELWTGGFDN